jgi:hypothetical protein
VYVADVLEHPEVPTPFVAVAWKVVVLPAATVTAMPGEAKLAALPVAAGLPEQSAVVKILIVDPALAAPFTLGVVLLPGDVGSVPVTVGTAGRSCWV